VSSRSIRLLLVLFVSVGALAQSATKAKLSYKLTAVHIKGAGSYTEDQILAATGLRLGQNAADDDFKRAAEKLGSTGLFKDVSYSYQYSSAGCVLNIDLAENDQLAAVSFDNFVWFSDSQLFTLLRARLPLFKDRLPLGGDLPDQVTDALNSVLAEKNISGKAEYIRSAAMDGPIDSYIYKVAFHPVVIESLDFPGAAPSELPALQNAARQLLGKDYLRSEMQPHKKYDLLPVYLSRGYLKAGFDDAQPNILSDGPQTKVSLSFPVKPGIQYKLAGVEWKGNSVFNAEQLQKLIQLKTAEPANAVELDKDIQAVQKLYGTRGYLAAQVRPEPLMDDAQATVRYTLNVMEGDLYRMGDLQIDGISEAAANRMATQWQMKKGDPFDESYPNRFFQSLYRDLALSQSFNVAPKRTVNQQDKTVSVALHFVPKH
jgi:outer membrane protein insertion porin family